MNLERWLFDASTILVAVILAEVLVVYLQDCGVIPVPNPGGKRQ